MDASYSYHKVQTWAVCKYSPISFVYKVRVIFCLYKRLELHESFKIAFTYLEPIDSTAVNKRWELTHPGSEGISYW